MNARWILILLTLPAAASATIRIDDWDWNGKEPGGKMAPVSVPPALHRPALGTGVAQPGQVKTGLGVHVQGSRDAGHPLGNPYAENGHYWGGGISSRTGLAPGLELMMGLDYPFFVPSITARFQPLKLDLPVSPALTLEFGANAMPDLYGGGVFGLGIGPTMEVWAGYRGGWVLDRGYSQLSTGLTFYAGEEVDIGLGVSWLAYHEAPLEQTGRAALRFDFLQPDREERRRRTTHSATPLPRRGMKADEEPAEEGLPESRPAMPEPAESPQDSPRKGSGAQALLEAEDYKAAADAYEKELLEHPDDPVRWKGYATALDELGLSRKAERARRNGGVGKLWITCPFPLRRSPPAPGNGCPFF